MEFLVSKVERPKNKTSSFYRYGNFGMTSGKNLIYPNPTSNTRNFFPRRLKALTAAARGTEGKKTPAARPLKIEARK
jgi:hypothetical protein